MKTLLIAAMLLGWGAAGSLSAAEGVRDGDACPDRAVREEAKAYGLHAHDYCEGRWTTLLTARQTGGATHDEFIDGCLRRCATARGATSGAPLGWILGGVGAAALAGGVAAGAGSSHPPPASP
ncbi:MAG: hypothetical protein JWO83_2218 [Caulobacteraceae bacterium]|jgi:hypothetical protein|nr:hypothetical protein [Caulobacteraceae bacterium]